MILLNKKLQQIKTETITQKCAQYFLGDNVDHVRKINEGEVYEFYINVSSREYNERHYTTVDCWRAVQLNPEAPAKEEKEEKGFIPVGDEQADLPF